MSRSFFDFFPPPKILMPPISGVSISDDAIRVVAFRDKHGKLSLKNSAEYPLASGIISDGTIVDQAKFVDALKKVAKEQNVGACALSLPEEKSFVYATTVSTNAVAHGGEGSNSGQAGSVDKESLRSVVEVTLTQNIPLSAAEAVFDFVVTGFDTKNQTADVVISAFPLDVAHMYLEDCTRAGITPVCFETESQAVARAVAEHGKKGTHLVLHFLAYKAIIAVVADGVVYYASTVSHTSGSNEPVELLTVKDELAKVVSYWHSERQAKLREQGKIQSVIVSGKVDTLLDLPDYISKNLQMPSHMANVWQNAFSVNETIPEVSFEKSLAFASASGSALLPFLSEV